MFLFQLISVLLISNTLYTYLSNIFFSCDLAFKVCWLAASIGEEARNELK